MTKEVDLFEDESEQPSRVVKDSKASRVGSGGNGPKRKKRRSVLADPVIQRMVVAAAAVVILWTAAIASSIVFGLSNPPAPRTQIERQLDMLAGVVQSNPKSTPAWTDYATALISAKQYSTAEDVIERGLKVAPEKSPILVQKARLAQKRGDDDEALEVAALAAKTARAEREADSKALEKTGSRARLLPKGLTGALIITAEIQAKRGEWDAVVKAWDEFLNLEPTDCAALVARGDAHAKLGNKKKAESDYRTALKYIPDMPEALKGLETIGASDK